MEERPDSFDSYEKLLALDEIEAVYVPLPTALRKEWVLKAAARGKHVICEKPCADSVPALEEMLEACHANRVQFMDGVMFMHSRRLTDMKRVLEDGESVGPLKRITSAFSFASPPEFFSSNIRGNGRLEPLGCLGDLGWYCIRFTLWAMDWQMPREVTARAHSEVDAQGCAAVPTDFSGELLFDGSVSAGFYCSFLAENQQWATLSGACGYLHIPDFVLPFRGKEISFRVQNSVFETSGCHFRMEPHEKTFRVPESSHGHPSSQEANLFRNFSNQVRSGTLNLLWPEMALKTQKVISACFESARHHGRAVAV